MKNLLLAIVGVAALSFSNAFAGTCGGGCDKKGDKKEDTKESLTVEISA